MGSIENKNYLKVTYANVKSSYPEKMCKYIFDKYPKNFKVLDLGCGNGDITEELKKMGFDVYGADAHGDAKSIIGNKFKSFNLEKEGYDFENNFFDIVFTKSVVEHLRSPEILFDEVHRILKPGGIHICMTPSWEHNYKRAFYVNHTHYTPFTKHSLETIFKIHNHDVVESKYFYQFPFYRKNKWSIVLIKLLNLFNLPYKPFDKINWPTKINKVIRFSKETMLFVIGQKPKNNGSTNIS